MLSLILMDQREFRTYIDRLIPNFADELEKSGEYSHADGLERSRQTVSELLPDGLNTRDHFLFNVKEGQESIGILYLAFKEENGHLSAFIYDIEIAETLRGRGYGAQAMRLAEEFAKSRRAEEVWLHVFAANTVAFNLYRKLGYEVRKELYDKSGKVLLSRRMAKSL